MPHTTTKASTSRRYRTKWTQTFAGGPIYFEIGSTERALVLEDNYWRMVQFRNLLGSSTKIVSKAPAAIRELQQQQFDLVCLDHDLGIDSGTGNDVAVYLAEAKYAGRVVIHSWNAVASQRMEQTLRDAGVKVERIPFGMFAFFRARKTTKGGSQ
jgi:CheY-like chemotaxis protein